MKGKFNSAKAEYRAEEIKSLEEKRGALIAEMDGLIGKTKAEVRAFTEEETKRISEIEKEVEGLNAAVDAERRAEAVKAKINFQKQEEKRADVPAAVPPSGADSEHAGNVTEAEKRAFASFIQSGGQLPAETRAGEQNITMGNNGAVIPTSIADMIVSKVNEICPIMNGATKFAVKGTLKVPVWGKTENGHDITVGYQEEFKDITADAGAFTSIDLSGHLIGSLVLIGKSVINNSQIDITSFVVSEIAKKVAEFNEKELLIGTENKIEGALETKNTLTANGAAAVTADELIELQAKIPTVYQANACWTMHPDTFVHIKKLKDANGQFLMMSNTGNITNSFPYVLLGKPVYLSDNMPKPAAGAKSILYGDYSGVSINLREQIELQVLNEKYATQHAVGIVVWYELDGKVTDHQKLAVLVNKDTASAAKS
ncbi:MAG: phage major capsid protein [Ruminococcus sp.]|nr:phage major capsid protein [Ruminococcus sp.]MCM1380353.1 phage major capsid protein [Muribaculaceae bacterium]MCM1478337.1 phage major capsid protein [Muribaculaceae bacterium]